MSRMKRSGWIVASVLVLAGLAAWLVLRKKPETVAVDLVAELPHVVRAIPDLPAFQVKDVRIAGVTRRSITATGQSRLAWHVTVPDHAWLSFSLGVPEESWTRPDQTLQFRVTVYDEELLKISVDPQKNDGDKRWQDFLLDLSEYAGETVDIYLKTDAQAMPTPQAQDTFAWGNPRVIIR
jgi:hypothetical protein